MRKLGFLALMLALNVNAIASQDANPYYQVKKVILEKEGIVISEVQLTDSELDNVMGEASGLPVYGQLSSAESFKSGGIGGAIMTINQLIALGEKIYKIIEKGKPVVNTSYAPISVLPTDENNNSVNIMHLANWSAPKAATYTVKYVNGFNMSVVEFDFTIIFSYGGTYQGKGKYITAAQIIPKTVSVAWGYNVSATMKLDGIMNNGSTENVVAGALLRMDYQVKTVVKEERKNLTFFINGLGQLTMY